MIKLIKQILLFICFVAISFPVAAQTVIVKGVVYKAGTTEPVEFANVYVKASTVGTITNEYGKFSLRVDAVVDELQISAIGFLPAVISLSGNTDSLVGYLEEDVIAIDEIVVSLGDNPALAMHDSIVKYKKDNDPDYRKDYRTDVYENETYFFTGLDSGFANNAFFRKHKSAFVKTDEKDTLLSFPVYQAERITTVNRQANPYKERKELVAEKKNGVNFITGPEITSMVGTIETNFYKSHLFLLDKDFLSPLSNGAKLLYNFYVIDTNIVKSDTLYRIKYKPKLVRDLLLMGNFWYNSNTHAVTDIYAEIHPKANLNFIKNFKIHKTYERVDSAYFWGKEHMQLDFVYNRKQDTAEQQQTVRLLKDVVYTNTALNGGYDDSFLEQKSAYELIRRDDVFEKDSAFWEGNRPIERDTVQKQTEDALTEVNKIGIVQFVDWGAHMLMNGWIDAKYIEIGPWENLIKSNEVEGFRMTFGARLAPEISKRFLVSGFAAYGTKDKEFKYGGALGYSPRTTKYQVIQARVEDNVITIGNYKNNISYIRENLFVRTEDNIFGNLLKREDNFKLYHLTEAEILHAKEWRPGIYTRLFYNYFEHSSREFVPFYHNGTEVFTFTNREITLHARFTKDEKVVNNYFRRVYYLTKNPRFHLIGILGKYNFTGVTGEYFHLRSVVEHYYPVGIGKLGYLIEAGHIWGNVPFPLLEIPRGNESYGYARFNYNLMDIMEFANDTYCNLLMEYQTNGFFLNRVPLIRALKLRESFTGKFSYGTTREGHEFVMEYPDFMSPLNGFYGEVGVGFTNLFKCIRMHYTHRLTQLDKDDVLKDIFQIGFYVEF